MPEYQVSIDLRICLKGLLGVAQRTNQCKLQLYDQEQDPIQSPSKEDMERKCGFLKGINST